MVASTGSLPSRRPKGLNKTPRHRPGRPSKRLAPPIPQLLSVTPPRALLRNDIYTMAAPLPSYRRGGVVLLSDAAHAMTPDLGQGAALALEDAVTLAIYAGHATSSDRDLDAALARYDEERRPRTQRLVRISASIGRIGQAATP
jgi:2-polyprenyl-6-methoxyphenol hydroxylase-like FAD-dependent oxidoreductase